MRTAVIDVGGGMRAIFGCGVFDCFLENNITFDSAYGVSAGASNIATFLAHQKKRMYRFYTDYSFRKEYMSVSNFIKKGSFLDMEYIYKTLPEAEDPFDYETFEKDETLFKMVATDGLTGESVYFDKATIRRENNDTMRATASLPVINKPTVIDSVPYFDGGISDPIPFRKAIEDGADFIIIILTKPQYVRRKEKDDDLFVKLLKRKYPAASEVLRRRAETYNSELDEAEGLVKEGRALIISPDDTFGITTTKKDRAGLEKFYIHGYEKAQSVIESVKHL